jgi:N-formylglutamate amidohydrolase
MIIIPHAGKFVPEDVKSDNFCINDYDLYADEIFSQFDTLGTIIKGFVHRKIVDLNRARDNLDDFDGVLPLYAFDGRKFREACSHDEKERLLQKYWDPFHGRIVCDLTEKLALYKRIFIIAGHTMQNEPPVTAKVKGQRPDICISTNHGKMVDESLLEVFLSSLQNYGQKLDVALDFPFIGAGYITKQYANPGKGINIIQVEVNGNCLATLHFCV